MPIYWRSAVRAVDLIRSGEYSNPKDAWFQAVSENSNSIYTINKGCPRGAFLGLCEEGIIKGVPKGNYTGSVRNKGYALKAVEILHLCIDAPTVNELWTQIAPDINHSGQMDVVLSLWEKGYLRGSIERNNPINI